MARKSTSKREPAKKWKPLDLYQHQVDAVNAFKSGINRLFLAWHRRAGKDTFALDFARERMHERIGTYWHLFPFHVQAKRAIWKGIDARTGERFIDRAFPKAIRDSENDTEMSINLKIGSTWQMLGSDNYDRMIGSNPCGIIFSEWALCDPAAWDYIRPILVENNGWAMFITTFRGRNHAWRMFDTVRELDNWYADLKTIDDTYRHDGKRIVTEADVQREIREGMDPALVQQEFYCNPDAVTSGAIFGNQLKRLQQLDPTPYRVNNKVVRVAWGIHEEGIAAIVFQDNHIIAVHKFVESNLTDAAQAVTRRHPHCPLIHHAINPDPSLFNEVDGVGIVSAQVNGNTQMQHASAAMALNTCQATSIAREVLQDFTMSFAPYRDLLDDSDLSFAALAQALAVMRSGQMPFKKTSKPLDYSKYDRGII